ncbi:transposase [Bacillus thuringiensis]|nr:transposase [Bacillus thuringiensis]
MERNVSTITIAHKDRVFRFDYDWFDGFLHKWGVKVIIVTNERLSPQEEFA